MTSVDAIVSGAEDVVVANARSVDVEEHTGEVDGDAEVVDAAAACLQEDLVVAAAGEAVVAAAAAVDWE